MNCTNLSRCVLGAGLLLSVAALSADVEVTLKDRLDGNLNGYCLDIRGGGQNIDPSQGLQAHTCYSYRGDLGSDQAFDPELMAGVVRHILPPPHHPIWSDYLPGQTTDVVD